MAQPFDVMDTGRMAVVADPSGARFSVCEAGRHIGAEVVSEPGTLSWHELTTRDVHGSKELYGAVFGWRTRTIDFGGTDDVVWYRAGEREPAQRDPQWPR